MFKKIMILAATTSFIALAAPHTASFAQTAPGGAGNTLEDIQRQCREDAADDGFRDGMRYTDWANTESRQAADYRELSRNARNSAKTSTSKADQDMWNADADRYDANAEDLEAKAKRDLDRGKAGFAKFREQEPCVKVVAAMNEFIDSIIEDGELRATHEFWDEPPIVIDGEVIDPAKIKREADKAEKAEPKVEPAPRQEKKKLSEKKPQKVEKQKKQARLQKSGNATQDVAQSIARDVAVNVASQLILGEIGGMGHKHKKHHKAERRETMDGMAFEEFQPRRKMKIKKLMGVGFGMF